jgi:UPF0755 protein
MAEKSAEKSMSYKKDGEKMNKTSGGVRRAVTFFVLFVGMVLFTVFFWFKLLNPTLIPAGAQPQNITILPGSGARVIALQLQGEGIVAYPELFVLLSHLQRVSHKLRAGEYRLDPGITAVQFLRKMMRGDAITHTITIVEGWTFKHMLAAMNNNPYLVHTMTGLSDDEIMRRIGCDGKAAEGVFAPDTYVFSGKVSDVEVLRTAYNLMQKRLNVAWVNRASETVYTYHCPNDALIVASLIEKETANKAEKSQIAGVILRRLQKNMPLQIDATVIYGLGDQYRGKLNEHDLLFDSSYNTYRHSGLPPTPIAMPGLDSIVAALHPDNGTSLYYVAKGDGTHVFSDTLAEHDAAIRKYLLPKK